MRYQLYRNTTPGTTLQESLDEMIENNQMSAYAALQVMSHFDEVINHSLSNENNNNLTFKGSLSSYRYLDNVWTFVVDTLSIKDGNHQVNANNIKIVACEGKLNTSQNQRKRKISGSKNSLITDVNMNDEDYSI